HDDPRVLLRSGAAALDDEGDAQPMVAAVNQFTLQRRLFGPARLLEAAIERGRVIAAVAGGLGEGFARLDGSEVVGHLMRGDQVAAADVEPIEAEVDGRQLE